MPVRTTERGKYSQSHRFSSIGLAVLINRIGKSNVTVGVDGSLYRYHPRFKRNMERTMETLVDKETKVFSKDFSQAKVLPSFVLVQIGLVR